MNKKKLLFFIIATIILVLLKGSFIVFAADITSPYKLTIMQVPEQNILKVYANLPEEVTKFDLVFSDKDILVLQKSANNIWQGSIVINDYIKNNNTCFAYLYFGELKRYSSSLKYKYKENITKVLSYSYFVKHIEKGRVLHFFIPPDLDKTFTEILGEKFTSELVLERNEFFGIKKAEVIGAPQKPKAFLDAYLNEGYLENNFYKFEIKNIEITGATANSLLQAGLQYGLDWENRSQGKTKLFNLAFTDVLNMAYMSQPDFGRNNFSLKKLYARFRGNDLLIEFGDISQKYSNLSLAGNFLGLGANYDLFWGLSFNTMAGFANRSWDWLYDNTRPSKYRESLTSFSLTKDLGNKGQIGLYYANANEDPQSLTVNASEGPYDKNLMGIDFSLKKIFNYNLSIFGEYNSEKINTNNVSAYQLKMDYGFDIYEISLFFSQIDPAYRAIGQTVNSDRREISGQIKSVWLEKTLKVIGLYKTYRDNLQSNLTKTTTVNNPRLTVEYSPKLTENLLKNFKAKFFFDQKKQIANNSSIDLTANLAKLTLQNAIYDIDYSAGLKYQDETNAVSSSSNEKHQILFANSYARFNFFKFLNFNFNISYDNDLDLINKTTENIFNKNFGISINIFGSSELGYNFSERDRSGPSAIIDKLTSIEIPFIMSIDEQKTRKISISYKINVYTFLDTSQDYTENMVLFKTIWEL